MECYFKKGFDSLKEEILKNGSNKHLICFNGKAAHIDGTSFKIDSFEYIFCKYIHPYLITLMKNDKDGIFFEEKYLFEKSRIGRSKYEYIIKIENKEKYRTATPLMLHVKSEWKGVVTEEYVKHTGYYNCGGILGLTFHSSGSIGFIPENYVPMLKGEAYRNEHYGGRGNKKLLGYTDYNISGDNWVKDLLINEGEQSLIR